MNNVNLLNSDYITYRCPKFHLSSNNSNRVLTLNLDLLIVNDEIFESFDTFTSEGYVSLPEGLRQELEIINKGPDSVLYMTYLVEKVRFSPKDSINNSIPLFIR